MSSDDARLAALVALPFDRDQYLARVGRLRARYASMEGLLLAPEGARARLEILLMRDHPSGLRELGALELEGVRARSAEVAAELRALKAAAPLPAPMAHPERARVLAVADVEHWMRELLLIRRGNRRVPPRELVERYLRAARPDPLTSLDAELVRAICAIPRGQVLRRVLALASARHGVPELPRAFAAPERKRDSGDRVRVCAPGALAPGRGCAVEAFGGKVALLNDRGRLHAIDDRCPHRGGLLSEGEVEPGTVVCPLHGWVFELETGAMKGSSVVRLETFIVEEDCEGIWVRRKG